MLLLLVLYNRVQYYGMLKRSSLLRLSFPVCYVSAVEDAINQKPQQSVIFARINPVIPASFNPVTPASFNPVTPASFNPVIPACF